MSFVLKFTTLNSNRQTWRSGQRSGTSLTSNLALNLNNMALQLNGVSNQRDGSSSYKNLTIVPPGKYQAPINSLMVVLPQLLGWLGSADIEARREQIGRTFACYPWEEIVGQAHEVYTTKRRTLRIDSLEAFMEQVELIHYYHTAARHALTRK